MAFLIVGIPDVIFDRVMSRVRADLKGQALFASPLRKNSAGNYAVDLEACDRALQSVSKALRADPQCLAGGLGVVILRRPWEQPRFSDFYFPFGLVRHAVSENANIGGRRLKEVANATSRAVTETCRILIGPIKAARNRYESTAGKTRALLPIKNFSSPVLRDGLVRLSEELPYSDDPKKMLKEFDEALSELVPSRRERDHGAYFEDAANKWFKMPGRALHGRVRILAEDSPSAKGAGAHILRCHLAAKLRLGGTVIEGFHFDCTAKGKALVGDFEICHSITSRYHGRPHLNIYVNDFIRA